MAITQDSEGCFVIDTSSVIQIKQIIPQADRKAVFATLTEYVDKELLVYPKEVLDELEKGTADQPCAWAKHNCSKATRYGPLYNELRAVLSHPQAKRVLDPNKVGVIEADPHVLALAVHLRTIGKAPIVLTEESKSRPNKLSLTQVWGVLRFVPLSIAIFLEQENIWQR